MIGYLFSNPIELVIYLLAILVAISIHEFAHAWTADRLGDPTARSQGRLSLDPRVHLDALGMILLLIIGFGWGKPVPFDPFNLKNPRRDAALISIAGPVSNFILALLLSFFLRIIILSGNPFLISLSSLLFIPLIQLNIILGVFNLLPIAPLDGFKVVGGLLSEEKAAEWYQLEKYGFLLLLLLIIPLGNSSMLDSIIRPVVSFFYTLLIPSIGSSI